MHQTDLAPLRSLLQEPGSLVTDLSGRADYFRDATEQKVTPRAIMFALS
jgi:hypothetical protein